MAKKKGIKKISIKKASVARPKKVPMLKRPTPVYKKGKFVM